MSETRSAGQEKDVLIFGTFDVRNYGDILFPLIARRRLAPHGMRVRAVSPTAVPTGWRDAMPPEAVKTLLTTPDTPAAVLIGGGNIVHGRSVTLPDYLSAGVREWAYPSLWLGATLIAAVKNAPLAWNAPGVPWPLGPREIRYAKAALEAADYVSVRDEASLANLADAAPADAVVTPDTALDIAALWPRASLEDDFRQLLVRKGHAATGGFVAIHVKARSLAAPMESVAAGIDAFARKFSRTPILVAIGPCHDDHVTARRLSRFVKTPHVTLDDALGLREIASAIAFSDIYVGCSLHGYVTSFAYGRRGVIVAQPLLPKFPGLLAHLGRQDSDLATDWESGFEKAAALMEASPRSDAALPREVAARLDKHWAAIAAAFDDKARKSAHRIRFLRRAIYFGIERGGWDWAMKGFSPD